MKHTLEALWNGNIAPCEQCGRHDPEILDLLSLMEKNKAALCKEMTASQQDIFEKYIDCSDEYLIRISELAFSDGFCLAAKLLTESLY